MDDGVSELISSSDGKSDGSSEVMYREDLFEGDIVLISNSAAVVNHTVMKNLKTAGSVVAELQMITIQHNAVRQKTLLWPDGRVPYAISPSYANISKLIIMEAMEEYQRWTCVRFVPKEQLDFDYIYIVPHDGCYSMVGNNGGMQVVSLGDGCLKKGIVIHELMHVIGFFHEQNRADRDLYVSIRWENVKTALFDQFEKYSPTIIDHLGAPYDYNSVMHYATTAFSRNGRPTIIPKSKRKDIEIGQRRGFSHIDIWKINRLYNCTKRTSTPGNKENEKESEEMESTVTTEGQFSTTIRNLTVAPTSTSRNTTTNIAVTLNNKNSANSQEFRIKLNLSALSTLPSTSLSTYSNSSLTPFGMLTPTEVIMPTTSGNLTRQKMRYCTDRHPHCQLLRSRDFCAFYLRFVQDYCARTCNKC
uniref:Metalloendopeptidase n=1 Tax=Setaria digitata TaxID=48799 RepID=A0A915PYE1_9BILA